MILGNELAANGYGTASVWLAMQCEATIMRNVARGKVKLISEILCSDAILFLPAASKKKTMAVADFPQVGSDPAHTIGFA